MDDAMTEGAGAKIGRAGFFLEDLAAALQRYLESRSGRDKSVEFSEMECQTNHGEDGSIELCCSFRNEFGVVESFCEIIIPGNGPILPP